MIQWIHFKIEDITCIHNTGILISLFSSIKLQRDDVIEIQLNIWNFLSDGESRSSQVRFRYLWCFSTPHGGPRSVICIVWEYRGYIDFCLLSKFLYLSDIRIFDCSVSRQKEIWLEILRVMKVPRWGEVRGERRDGDCDVDPGGGGGAQPGQPGGVEPQWGIQRPEHINLPDRRQYLYQEGNVSSYLGLHIIIITYSKTLILLNLNISHLLMRILSVFSL